MGAKMIKQKIIFARWRSLRTFKKSQINFIKHWVFKKNQKPSISIRNYCIPDWRYSNRRSNITSWMSTTAAVIFQKPWSSHILQLNRKHVTQFIALAENLYFSLTPLLMECILRTYYRTLVQCTMYTMYNVQCIQSPHLIWSMFLSARGNCERTERRADSR